MLESVWLALFVGGLGGCAAAFWLARPTIVGSALNLLTWFILALTASNIQTVSNGSIVTTSNEPAAILCGIVAVVNLPLVLLAVVADNEDDGDGAAAGIDHAGDASWGGSR